MRFQTVIQASIFAASALFTLAANSSTNSNPFLGTWKVANAKIAPWYDGSGANPIVDQTLIYKTIVFGKSKATGSPTINCDSVKYTLSTITPDSLFEGVLKNPIIDATELGFKNHNIITMNESCLLGGGDMELDFPMVNANTILLGLNNMIYILKRVH